MMINNVPFTESSFMITESMDNGDTLTDGNYTLRSHKEGNSFDKDATQNKDLSIIYESFKEHQDKMDTLTEKIMEKDKVIKKLEKKNMEKEIKIKELEKELEKSQNNLYNMKINVGDLKQRAKVLENYLAEHTNKQ